MAGFHVSSRYGYRRFANAEYRDLISASAVAATRSPKWSGEQQVAYDMPVPHGHFNAAVLAAVVFADLLWAISGGRL